MNDCDIMRGQICKVVDFCIVFWYTIYTFPPIFRDGVRGGSAASAV